MTSAKPFEISKRRVSEAYRHVRAQQAGIDDESIEMFEADLSRNLCTLWNRMASGSYFPPPMKQVEIARKRERQASVGDFHGRRPDRPTGHEGENRREFAEFFHPDSYGHRPNKSAADAIAVTRKRCWKYDWCVEFDIRRAFDELDWNLMRKVIRWLTAPVVTPNGQTVQRIPRGSVIGPVLMNAYMLAMPTVVRMMLFGQTRIFFADVLVLTAQAGYDRALPGGRVA